MRKDTLDVITKTNNHLIVFMTPRFQPCAQRRRFLLSIFLKRFKFLRSPVQALFSFGFFLVDRFQTFLTFIFNMRMQHLLPKNRKVFLSHNVGHPKRFVHESLGTAILRNQQVKLAGLGFISQCIG